MTKTIIYSYKILTNKLPIVLLYYALTLLLASVLALPFFNIILREANHSLAVEKLLPDFNFTIFTDFVQHYGKAFSPLFKLVIPAGLLFWLIKTFFDGGLLEAINKTNEKLILKVFFKDSAACFSKFLGLGILSFLLFLAFIFVSAVVFYIFYNLASGGNERTYILLMIPPCVIMFLLLGFVYATNYYAKVFIVKYNLNSSQAFFGGIKYCIKNFKTFQIFWVIILVSFLLLGIYLGFDSFIGMKSGFTVFIMFLVQQASVFLSTFLKNLQLVAANNYLDLNPLVYNNVSKTTETNLEEQNDVSKIE